MPQPLWRRTQQRAASRRSLGASAYLARQIAFGINDPPVILFKSGEGLGELPQAAGDLPFGLEDLAKERAEGIYEELGASYFRDVVARGYMVSSSFVVLQDGSEGWKGRFVVNFAKQSQYWEKGSVRMETIPAYALELQAGDHMLSFDIKAGYRHLRLAPQMQDIFIFRCNGRFYRCVALPFGWGRLCMWFTRLMKPLIDSLRSENHLRVLPYLDDFLICPRPPGTVASLVDCFAARTTIAALLEDLGLVRHPTKGEWVGSTRVEHLGVVIKTVLEKFFIAPRKIAKVRHMAKHLISESTRGRRWVSVARLRSFVGLCVSLTLAMPFARFYTRSLYWDMHSNSGDVSNVYPGSAKARGQSPQHAASLRALRSTSPATPQARSARTVYEKRECVLPRAARGGARCRLSYQGIRDLRTWCELTNAEREGRPLRPVVSPAMTLHTDAADVGYGGTLGPAEKAGSPELWAAQGVWDWQSRAESISYRELRAVRMLLMNTSREHEPSFGARPRHIGVSTVSLLCGNTATVHVINAMVSASRLMMRELRLLRRERDRLKVHIDARWLPSVPNKYADALSRRFTRGDLRIRRSLRRSVADGMRAPATEFPYQPLGENPVFLRRQSMAALQTPWDISETRVLCPPIDLLPATVRKLRHSGCPAVLLMPDWPAQAWHPAALQLSTHSFCLPHLPHMAWDGARTLNKE